MQRVDLIVMGGGIVGLATAFAYTSRFPEARVVIIEKEADVALHQSGRNSGVLHTGIYYKPGSLKAESCIAGKRRMESFCRSEGIEFKTVGKLIVAADEREIPGLEMLFARGTGNGVRCEIFGPSQMREIEPHAAGVRALFVRDAGVVDFRRVALRLAEILRQRGAELLFGQKVEAISPGRDEVVVRTGLSELAGSRVVNCAGLYSDRVAAMTAPAGETARSKIIPFRGEYYRLKPERSDLCRGLIYPVPDPQFPFLGVHFTRRIDGEVECGPNAILALAREGYRKRDINLRDLAESLTYPGFLRFSAKHWRVGAHEIVRSMSKVAFVRALQKLVPAVRADDLEEAPAGVRAQALTRDGQLVDDFLIEGDGRIIHVINAPSPAATASLQIGESIVDRLE